MTEIFGGKVARWQKDIHRIHLYDMLNVPKKHQGGEPYGQAHLSQISSDENTENTDLETTVFFDINIRVPCKIGSLDAMALKLRSAVMPVLAEQLGQFMIKVDTLIKDSAERKKRRLHY